MIRANIELDEKLVEEGLKLTGLKTKKELINQALQEFVRRKRRKGILRYAGSNIWSGDLKKSRESRV